MSSCDLCGAPDFENAPLGRCPFLLKDMLLCPACHWEYHLLMKATLNASPSELCKIGLKKI